MAAAKRQLLGWCLVAAVAMASAQQGRFTTVTFPKFEKRRYQFTCTEKKGPGCYVGCPKECPNKCLASCKHCLTICSTYHACIHLIFSFLLQFTLDSYTFPVFLLPFTENLVLT
jgi:hypothetical protein